MPSTSIRRARPATIPLLSLALTLALASLFSPALLGQVFVYPVNPRPGLLVLKTGQKKVVKVLEEYFKPVGPPARAGVLTRDEPRGLEDVSVEPASAGLEAIRSSERAITLSASPAAMGKLYKVTVRYWIISQYLFRPGMQPVCMDRGDPVSRQLVIPIAVELRDLPDIVVAAGGVETAELPGDAEIVDVAPRECPQINAGAARGKKLTVSGRKPGVVSLKVNYRVGAFKKFVYARVEVVEEEVSIAETLSARQVKLLLPPGKEGKFLKILGIKNPAVCDIKIERVSLRVTARAPGEAVVDALFEAGKARSKAKIKITVKG